MRVVTVADSGAKPDLQKLTEIGTLTGKPFFKVVVMSRFSLAILFVFPLAACADDSVGVPGSEIRFVPKVQQRVKGQLIDLKITGTALRTKYTFKVYGMASYLQDGVAVASAEELAASEKPKLLHMVMERKVTGSDFVDAFRTAIGKERAKKEFATEFTKLSEAVNSATADKGDYVILYYVPGDGTQIRIGQAVDVTIPGQSFSRAIWETFLGKNSIDSDIKKGLVSQIGK